MEKQIRTEVVTLLTPKDTVQKVSCYGSHDCVIRGPAKVTTTYWPDGGIDQKVENLPKKNKK